MLDDAVTKARRLVADLERDAAELAESASRSGPIPPHKQAEAKKSIETALAAARRLLEALQEAAKSEKLR